MCRPTGRKAPRVRLGLQKAFDVLTESFKRRLEPIILQIGKMIGLLFTGERFNQTVDLGQLSPQVGRAAILISALRRKNGFAETRCFAATGSAPTFKLNGFLQSLLPLQTLHFASEAGDNFTRRAHSFLPPEILPNGIVFGAPGPDLPLAIGEFARLRF